MKTQKTLPMLMARPVAGTSRIERLAFEEQANGWRWLRRVNAVFIFGLVLLLLANEAPAAQFTGGPSVRVSANDRVEFRWSADVGWLAFVEVFSNADGTGALVVKVDSVDAGGAPVIGTDHLVKINVALLQQDASLFFRITMTDPTGSNPIPLVTQAPLPPFFTGAQTIGSVFVDAGVDRAQLFWDANVIGIGRVDYGIASPDEFSVEDLANGTRHSIGLTGLAPGTTYQVRVSNHHAIDGDSLAEKTGSFTTLPSGDSTPPTIIATVPNQTLWYGSDVSVACTAMDSGSGLANPSDASFTLSTSVPTGTETGSAVTDSRQVCDQANNCATAGPFALQVDKKPPQLLSSDAPDGLWHASDVTLRFHYADGGSGPAAQDIALTTHVPDGTDDNNAIASAGGSRACDNASNCAPAPADIAGNKIDKKKPVITISVPASGATYAPGQIIAAAYDCNDGTGSGIATCAGPVANGDNIDTSAGTHVFTVTATDNVGNVNSASVTYSVAGYTFSGFLSPVDNPPTVNTGKAGRTYPINWQLRDANGNFVSALSAIAAVVIKPTPCDTFTNDPADALETSTTGGTGLRYDSATNQYQYNWATPGKGCYTLFLKLDSGEVFTAFFQLN